MPGSWIGSGGASILSRHTGFDLDDNHVLSSFDPSNVYSVLAEPNLWIGVVAGLALIAAAIWFRQRRIETAS